MLDNNYALLFIRGERPIKDLKFNLKEHFNSSKTPIGNKLIPPYIHGGTEHSVGSISFNLDDIEIDVNKIQNLEILESEKQLLSDDEIESLLREDINVTNSI